MHKLTSTGRHAIQEKGGTKISSLLEESIVVTAAAEGAHLNSTHEEVPPTVNADNSSCEENPANANEANHASSYGNISTARTRRNAIDFSPVDLTNEDPENIRNQDIAEDNSEVTIRVNGCDTEMIEDKPSSIEDTVTEVQNEDNDSNPESTMSKFENSSEDGEDIFDAAGVSSDQKEQSENMEKQFIWSNEMTTLQRRSQTVDDMNFYKIYSKACHNLCNLPVNPSFIKSDTLTHPSAALSNRPLTAKQLLPQLDCCFAYLHGGKDVSDAPIICLPHFPGFRDVPQDNFQDVILYLTSVTSVSAADVGFVLILDRRRDKWSSLKSVLVRLASFFPGFLKMVLVLRPVGFFQGKLSDINFRWRRDDFSMKVPIIMLSNLDELYHYVEPSQLTQEYGGNFEYDHKAWIRNRMLIEDFTSHASDIGKELEEYGTELAATEYPNDVPSTQQLIKLHEDSTDLYKEKLDGLMKAAVTLENTIQTPLGGSILSNAKNTFEAETLRSIMTLVTETDSAFDKFWQRHQEKLQQCLELRRFEQNFKEARSKLNVFEQWLESQSNNVGTTVSWVESLIQETEKQNESFLEISADCSQLADVGSTLIENNHYAVDCIAPKSSDLIQVSSTLAKSFKFRLSNLSETLSVLKDAEELNAWSNAATTLLAGQTIEKPQTFDGAKQALSELETFFEKHTDKFPVKKDFIPSGLEETVHTANLHFEEVMQLYEKRRTSLKKAITRHGDRPVQLVEPSKKPDKTMLSEKANKNTERNKCEVHSGSPSRAHAESDSESLTKQQHVMKELLATEQAYVDELKEIVEGYGHAIDDAKYANIVPEALKGNKTVLLGNMEDIYGFHSSHFLGELEECRETPTTVGKCFIKRKNDFNIYSTYCQNSARSEHLRSRIGEQHPFFTNCQKKLGHRLSLGAYLLKPVQRITKYQLLLQQMLKYSHSHVKELQEAVQTMLAVLKSVNDSMHLTAITGYQGSFDALGKLLMQGPFSLQIEHKKTKVKNLTRPRFSKTLQRHLFLFERELLFCKQQTVDLSCNETNASSNIHHTALPQSGNKGHCYTFKNSLKLSATGITENIKGDSKKFEIWYHGREDVYTLLAPTTLVKQDWVKEIKKVLLCQPKSEVIPSQAHKADTKKSNKVKRNESLNRKSRSAPLRSERSMHNIEKEAVQKKRSTLARSASMGKGKDKLLKRVNAEELVKPEGENKQAEVMAEGDVMTTTARKSRSLPRLLDPPHCISDTEENSDNSISRASSGCKFVVMKERKDVEEDELVIQVGDIVEVVESSKEGWVRVRIQQSGGEGLVPSNCLASLSDASSFESVSSYLSN